MVLIPYTEFAWRDAALTAALAAPALAAVAVDAVLRRARRPRAPGAERRAAPRPPSESGTADRRAVGARASAGAG